MNAKLIEPDGTENIVTTIDDAIKFCKIHSGWTWQTCDAAAQALPKDDLVIHDRGHASGEAVNISPDLSKPPARPIDKPEDVIMPFGKHKGKALGQILADDASYLDWLNNGEVRLYGAMAEAVPAMCQKYSAEIESAVENKQRSRRSRWNDSDQD
jgi:hypothetical protein